MQELRGPNNCAECGTDTGIEVFDAGDCGQLVIDHDGELVQVPGLAVCTDCAGSIMVGEREPTVTPERAVKFITEVYAPILAENMTSAYNMLMITLGRFMDCKEAAEKLEPSLEMDLAMIDMDKLTDLGRLFGGQDED